MGERRANAPGPASQARPAPRQGTLRTAPRQGALRTAPRQGAVRRQSGVRPMAPECRYALIKWALLAALLVYAVLVVGANSARDVDFAVIERAVAAAPGITALHALDENGFRERLDAGPDGCEGWLMFGSDEIMNVSELMIAKGGEAALDRLEEAAQGRLERQLSVFRSYGVGQKELLEGATVLRRGDYLFYAVGEDADRWEDAFLSCIR